MSYYEKPFPSAALDRWLTTPPEELYPEHEYEEEYEPDEEYWPEEDRPEDYYLDSSWEDRFEIQEPDIDF